MKAHIYSSISAHPLLHRLERIAQEMSDTYSRVALPDHAASTAIGQLHLSGRSGDDSVSATITQVDERSLKAALDNDASFDPVISKQRLEELLGPLLKRYNTTTKEGLASDDQVVMLFEDDVQRA